MLLKLANLSLLVVYKKGNQIRSYLDLTVLKNENTFCYFCSSIQCPRGIFYFL